MFGCNFCDCAENLEIYQQAIPSKSSGRQKTAPNIGQVANNKTHQKHDISITCTILETIAAPSSIFADLALGSYPYPFLKNPGLVFGCNFAGHGNYPPQNQNPRVLTLLPHTRAIRQDSAKDFARVCQDAKDHTSPRRYRPTF